MLVLQALQKAIDAVKPGVRYREVGDIISLHVGQQGFQVVRSYCGHGICDLFHCAPNLPHYAHNKVCTWAILFCPSITILSQRSAYSVSPLRCCPLLMLLRLSFDTFVLSVQAVGVMKEGQIFTIEPMVNMGTYRDRTWPDGWTAVTADGKRSAQFEHTLLVTATGCEVLTKRLPTSPPLWWEEQ